MSTLRQQFLAWIEARPRTYGEAMEAWRSSCPRFPVWEDALADGLVQIERADGEKQAECRVVLTQQGRAALAEGPVA